MYKLEIDQQMIDNAVNWHINNVGDPSAIEANKSDKSLIEKFAKSINVFYDDDPNDHFWNKYNALDKTHKSYQILVTKGKDRIGTMIGIPQNSICYENFDLTSVISALSFEVSDPEDYMEEPEESRKYKNAVKRYEKVSNKIFKMFGEDFYCFILGGSY